MSYFPFWWMNICYVSIFNDGLEIKFSSLMLWHPQKLLNLKQLYSSLALLFLSLQNFNNDTKSIGWLNTFGFTDKAVKVWIFSLNLDKIKKTVRLCDIFIIAAWIDYTVGRIKRILRCLTVVAWGDCSRYSQFQRCQCNFWFLAMDERERERGRTWYNCESNWLNLNWLSHLVASTSNFHCFGGTGD